MPSYYLDSDAPSHESAEMRIVASDELGALPFWPAHRSIRDGLLNHRDGVVVA